MSRGKPRRKTIPDSEGGERWVETEWQEDFNKGRKEICPVRKVFRVAQAGAEGADS